MDLDDEVSAVAFQAHDLLLGRYEIVRPLGFGGSAAVFLVRDMAEGAAERALKILHNSHLSDENAKARFRREAELLAKLSHPNIIRSFEFHQTERLCCVVLEHLEGQTLEEIATDRPIDIAEARDIAAQIVVALDAIHAMGIIHRDIKPENIFVTSGGTVKLFDLGLAHNADSTLTQTSQRIGALLSIPPEVWQGSPPSEAGDIYGLGMVLYLMLAGKPPIKADNVGDLIRLHVDGKITPPSSHRPEVPRWLDNLVLRMLAKNPESRPTMPELLESLPVNESCQTRVMKQTAATLPEETAWMSWCWPMVRDDSAVPCVTHSRGVPRTTFSSLKLSKLRLPKSAGLIIEIERPGLKILAALAVLCVFQGIDAYLTSRGLKQVGVSFEGNRLLRYLMQQFGRDNALLLAKGVTVTLLITITTLARGLNSTTKVLVFLGVILFLAAIAPWALVLWARS